MPTISMFYGIIIRMLYMDTKQHQLPHLHVEYQGMKAVPFLKVHCSKAKFLQKNYGWCKPG